MKILFISSGNSKNRISPIIKSQGESIRRKGIELEFITIEGKGISGYLKNIKRIRQKARGFDIIHAHYGLIGLLAGISFTNKPMVLSIMGTDITGNYYEKGKRSVSSYLIVLMSQIALFFSKVIIVKSKKLKLYIPSYHQKKTVIVPNGVNFSLFKPLGYYISKEKIKININEKIVLFLADSKKPNKNFTLVKEAVKKMNNNNIRLINPFPISQEEFVVYLNACDVFVLSSFSEGSPNVVKEAMACNCPIVSTDIGDVNEVFKKTDGCFLSSFDPEDFAEKIEKAIKYGKRTTGRNDITHLDSEKVANEIIDIYENII